MSRNSLIITGLAVALVVSTGPFINEHVPHSKAPLLKASMPANVNGATDPANAKQGDVRFLRKMGTAWKSTIMPMQPSSLWAWDSNGAPYPVLPSALSIDFGQLQNVPALPTTFVINSTTGHEIVNYSDGSSLDLGVVVGQNGTNGTNGTNGANATTTANATATTAGLESPSEFAQLAALPAFIKAQSYSVAVPTLAVLATTTINVTITGCTVGDVPYMSWTDTTLDGNIMGATVSATNTVTIRLKAVAAITSGNRNFLIGIIKH